MFEADTEHLENVEENPSSRRTRLYLSILIGTTAILGGVLFGYDLGIISSALLQLTQPMQLTCVMKELVVSGLIVGALFGSVFGGVLLDIFGRRSILIINSLVFVIGALILSVAQNYYIVFLGRLIVGISVSVAAMGECLYTSEISSREHRGKMVSLNEMGITVGILLAYLVGYLFIENDQGWRFMFGLSAVPAVLQFFCLLVLPPSPRFLIMEGRDEDAEAVLSRLRQWDVQEEMADIRTLMQNERNRSFLDLCSRTGNFHYRLFVGIFLSMFQQLTGQSNMIYYAPVLLQGLGLESNQISSLVTVGIGVVKVVSTFLAISIVDKTGRRTLLLFGPGIMALALMIIAVSASELPSSAHSGIYCVDKWIERNQNASIADSTAVDNDTLLNFLNTTASTFTTSYVSVPTASFISVFALMLYVAAYAFSFGPVSWLLLSEIYPPTLRGRAFSIATSLNWAFNLVVSLTFLSVLESIGAPITFGCYCFISVVAVCFVYVFIPETKGKSLEQISRDFDSGKSLPRFLRPRELHVSAGDIDPTSVTYSHLTDA